MNSTGSGKSSTVSRSVHLLTSHSDLCRDLQKVTLRDADIKSQTRELFSLPCKGVEDFNQ